MLDVKRVNNEGRASQRGNGWIKMIIRKSKEEELQKRRYDDQCSPQDDGGNS